MRGNRGPPGWAAMGPGVPGGGSPVPSLLVFHVLPKTILSKKFMRVLKMAIRYDAVTKPVTKPRNETPRVTKPTEERHASHGRPVAVLDDGVRRCREPGHAGGRPPAGAVAMSGAERVRKYRERRRGAVAAS
jgi:hypothetical protein